MKTSPTGIEKVALKYGLLTALGLITYFLAMKLVGWVQIVELRVLNFFILAAGVTFAIRYFNRTHKEPIAFLKSMGVGLFTTMIGVGIFAFFILIYLWQLDPALMESFQNKGAFGHYLDPITVAMAITMEGIGSGFLITFIAVQYLKGSYLDPQSSS